MSEPNTRLSGVKHELFYFKSEFSSSFEKLKGSIDDKLSDIDTLLDQIGCNIKRYVRNEVNEGMMNIKNSIINALKEENWKVQN